MMPLAAIVESVSDHAIRTINALEHDIVQAEDTADAKLWEQAWLVVEQLKSGLTQRQLAKQWISLRRGKRTGKPYSVAHVNYVKQVVVKFTEHVPRPLFRDAYNEVANASSNKVNRLQYQTGEYEWYSPRDVVDAARDVLGAIDLDPASREKANEVVQAAQIFTQDDDGLRQPWHGRVWMNPPYKLPEIKQFSEKYAAHLKAGDISAGIVLVNNATETQWFQTLASVSDAVCFPASRCRYWQPDRETTSTPLQGQAILYSGPDPAAFCRRFRRLGHVWVLPPGEEPLR